MYERHTYSSMTYSLPVKTGKHTIILKFAEVHSFSRFRCILRSQVKEFSILKLETQLSYKIWMLFRNLEENMQLMKNI